MKAKNSIVVPRKIYDNAGSVKELVFEAKYTFDDKLWWANAVKEDPQSFSEKEQMLAITILKVCKKIRKNIKKKVSDVERKKRKLERQRKKINR